MADAVAVKQEYDEDVIFIGFKDASSKRQGPGGTERTQQKKRARVDVELPTWKEVQERKRGFKLDVTTVDGDSKDKFGKIQSKVGASLSLHTVYERIKDIPMYDVTLTPVIRDVQVPRRFISSVYGGNARSTFPKVSKRFLDQHGLGDFMCVKPTYNPEVPLFPGAPGLWFAPGRDAHPWDRGIRRVFTCIQGGSWQYMGQYSFTPTKSLTLDELSEQLPMFYTTWARGIIQKNWGHHIKCFLAARKRFKCENPTEAQIQMVKDSREINNITEEYAKTAMVTGKVPMGVWEMRCVDYDAEFQRSVASRFNTWAPPPPKANRGKPAKQAGRKRKHQEDEDEDEEELNHEGSDGPPTDIDDD